MSRDLVPLHRSTCPSCDGEVVVSRVEQLALRIRHGGYGHNEQTTTRRCTRCNWRLVTGVQATNPRGAYPRRV